MARKGLGKFILGAGLGAGLGLLFAKKPGAETRKELRVRVWMMLKRVQEMLKK